MEIKIIDEDKFRSNRLTITYQIPKKKLNFASMFILSRLLVTSSANYPTQISLSRTLENLYGAYVTSNCRLTSQNYLVSFNLLWTEKKYLNTLRNIGQEVIKVLVRILDKGFSGIEEELGKAKEYALTCLKDMQTDPDTIATQLLGKRIAPEAPFSLLVTGTEEEINGVTRQQIRESLELLKASNKSMVFVGNATVNIIKFIQSKFGESLKPTKIKGISCENIENLDQFEERDFTQSVLKVAYSFPLVYDEETYIKNLMANTLIGTSFNSALFSFVREEKSLCYDIHSSVVMGGGLQLISAYIDGSTYHDSLKAIEKVMRELKLRITEDNILGAKAQLTDVIKGMDDDISSLSSWTSYFESLGIHYDEKKFLELIEKQTLSSLLEHLSSIHKISSYAVLGVNHGKTTL